MKYNTLSKKALKLMRITSAIGLFFLTAGAAAVFLVLFFAGNTAGAAAVITVTAVFDIVYFAAVPPLRWRRYTYLIESDRIEIVEGILFVTRTIVPIDRIHQIDIKRGPIDNAIGVAKVVVTTAGSAAVFRFLEPEKAEEIALYLNECIHRKLGTKGVSTDV